MGLSGSKLLAVRGAGG